MQQTCLFVCFMQVVCADKIYYHFYKNNTYKEWIADESFYKNVKTFYNNRPVSKETVLGIGNYSEEDLEQSKKFMNTILLWKNPPDTKRALDCGAGFGRVTKSILIQVFDKVDMVEQDEKFAKAALDYVGKDYFEKLGIMYKVSVQNFYPEVYYDLIWVQGVLIYLTDRDAISLLSKCRSALNPKGVIVIKEDVQEQSETVSTYDENETMIARTVDHTMNIIDEANLKVIDVVVEEDHNHLYVPVISIAAVPYMQLEYFLHKMFATRNLVILFSIALFLLCVVAIFKRFR